MKTWKRGEKKARFSFPSPLFRFGCLPPSPPLSPRSSKPLLSGWLRGVRTSVTHGLGRHEHREMISPWESCERALEKCGRQTAWRRLSWRGKERFLVRVCTTLCITPRAPIALSSRTVEPELAGMKTRHARGISRRRRRRRRRRNWNQGDEEAVWMMMGSRYWVL